MKVRPKKKKSKTKKKKTKTLIHHQNHLKLNQMKILKTQSPKLQQLKQWKKQILDHYWQEVLTQGITIVVVVGTTREDLVKTNHTLDHGKNTMT